MSTKYIGRRPSHLWFDSPRALPFLGFSGGVDSIDRTGRPGDGRFDGNRADGGGRADRHDHHDVLLVPHDGRVLGADVGVSRKLIFLFFFGCGLCWVTAEALHRFLFVSFLCADLVVVFAPHQTETDRPRSAPDPRRVFSSWTDAFFSAAYSHLCW